MLPEGLLGVPAGLRRCATRCSVFTCGKDQRHGSGAARGGHPEVGARRHVPPRSRALLRRTAPVYVRTRRAAAPPGAPPYRRVLLEAPPYRREPPARRGPPGSAGMCRDPPGGPPRARGPRRPSSGAARQPPVALLAAVPSPTAEPATLRSADRSTPAPSTRPKESAVTTPNDTISEVASASEPIADGAIRLEVYVMVATPAMAWLGFGPLRPAAAKASGTTTARRGRARGRPAARPRSP